MEGEERSRGACDALQQTRDRRHHGACACTVCIRPELKHSACSCALDGPLHAPAVPRPSAPVFVLADLFLLSFVHALGMHSGLLPARPALRFR